MVVFYRQRCGALPNFRDGRHPNKPAPRRSTLFGLFGRDFFTAVTPRAQRKFGPKPIGYDLPLRLNLRVLAAALYRK